MMKFNIILFTLLIVMMGCNNNNVPTIQSNGKLVIVDSSGIKPNLLLYKNNRHDGYYPVYYLGKLDDTVRLGEHPIPRYEVDPKKYSGADFTFPDSTKMRILVDTSFSLSHTECYEHFDEKEDSWLVDSTKSYKAIPILIYNLSNSIIPVGRSNSLGYMVRQIKNKTGEWVDIERPMDYYCLTLQDYL